MKFLRQDGWFQPVGPADVGQSTSTTTSVFFTASATTDTTLNNVSYVTGVQTAQGTTGVWFASGTMTFSDGTAASQLNLRLSDGTTVINSADALIPNTTNRISVTLSGVITNPAGNIRLSAINATGAHGSIKANDTGDGKDTILTVIRIG